MDEQRYFIVAVSFKTADNNIGSCTLTIVTEEGTHFSHQFIRECVIANAPQTVECTITWYKELTESDFADYNREDEVIEREVEDKADCIYCDKETGCNGACYFDIRDIM